MSNRQKTYLVALSVIVALIWWGTNREQNQQAGEPIKIGVLAPLTGSFSTFGQSIRNGLELAKEELIAEGTAQAIELVYEDVCLPKDAITAVQKFISVDQVQMIGASFCLIGLDAVIPTTEANKVIVFNTAANTTGTLNKQYVFSTNVSINEEAKKMVEYAYHTRGSRTAAVIFYATPLGDDYNKYLTEHFEALGGQVVISERGALEKTDFRTDLAKIKEQNVDAVFVVYLANSLGNFLKQAQELGVQAPIMSHTEGEDPKVLESAGAAAEGFIISSSEPAVETDAVKSFHTKYQQQFGVVPDVMARNAYDALRLQVTAFQKCQGAADCIRDELHQVSNYAGASGTITINADGSASKPTVFKIVRNGQFVRLDE